MGGGMVVESLEGAASNDNITNFNVSPQMHHVSYNPVQDSFNFASLVVGGPDVQVGGVTFDIHSVDSSNRVTDPFGIEAITMAITFLRNTQFDASTGTVRFYIVPQADPDRYGSASGEQKPFDNITGLGSTSPQFLGSHFYAVGQDINLYSVTLNAIATGETESNLFRVIKDSLWAGKMNISLDWSGDGVGIGIFAVKLSLPLLPFGLNMQTFPRHTGWVDAPNRKRTRAVHDYTMGYPALSDEFVQDGFLEGIMVHRDSWDPKDPEPTYVINPLEGVVDDEIVDLE